MTIDKILSEMFKINYNFYELKVFVYLDLLLLLLLLLFRASTILIFF